MKSTKILASLNLLMLLCGCGGNNNTTPISSTSSATPQITTTSTVDPLGDPNVVDLIIMAGQSNMEGHTLNSYLLSYSNDTMKNYYVNGFENTLIRFHSNNGTNKNEEFEPVKIGMGFNETRFGPEVGVAKKLNDIGRVRPTYLVKYALGGTNLYNQWKSPSCGGSNSLYKKMVDYIYDIILDFEEQGKEVKIKGLFWMQGESDATVDYMTDAYYENLEGFVNDFRYEFEDTYGDEERGIAFVDAGISDCSTWVNHEEINAAKKQFAESDPSKNYYFDTMEEGLNYRLENNDLFHFDSLSELRLGELFVGELLDNGWMD